MCTKMTDNIVLFSVSGTPVKISTEKLAAHPQSFLTEMVNTTVQPQDGFFVECCPKIFGYILRFVLNDMPINPVFVANKLGVSEGHIRGVIDAFKFEDIYLDDAKEVEEPKVEESKVEESKVEEPKVEESKVELPDQDIWTVASKGKLDKLKVWLESGIDPNIKCKFYGSTPLMYAAQNGRLECVQELFKYGVDVNATNNNGKTALHFGVSTNLEVNNNLDVINLLITMKADINLKDCNGNTCLVSASQYRSKSDVVVELIKNGALVNLANNAGDTPLFTAVICENLDIIKELIKHQADLNTQNGDGWTPLYVASRYGRLEMVQILIKSGANVNVRDNDGVLPLVVAAKQGYHDIVNALVSTYTQ